MKRLTVLILMLIATLTLTAGVSSAALSGAIADPMYIGVGARPLGMGKAYVAVAEDGDTIFLNPAGLGTIDSLKFTSMYSNLLSDVRYVVLGGAYPLDIGTLGGGYVGAGVDGVPITRSGPEPIGMGSVSSNVIFLSYGLDLGKTKQLGVVSEYGKNVTVGANLKFFNQSMSGTAEAEAGNGSGIDLDIGALYFPNKWLTLGISQQNTLPASMGGVMNYKGGVTESIPSLTKIGSKVNVLGPAAEALMPSDTKLNLALDADLSLMRSRPMALHTGVEFWPIKNLALRVGLDQDPSPNPGIVTNLTAGVGVRYADFEFNYAYHPYSGAAENTTHYFSVAYVGPEKGEIFLIEVTKPADKLITRANSVKVEGRVIREGVEEVNINGAPVPVKEGKFSKKVALDSVGKHLIVVTAKDKSGRVTKIKRRVLRLLTFKDVMEDYWARDQIEYAGTAGLVEGYPDGTFQPDRTLTRAELATLLVRAKGESLPQVTGNVFKDLPKTHWAARYVKAAQDMELVIGYPDGTFRPNNKINRVEGVTVMVRLDEGLAPEDLEVEEKPFKDIGFKHWAIGYITRAKEKGMLVYLGDKEKFEPTKELTRAEAVEVLIKGDYGKAKVADLLDWEKGYVEKEVKPKKEIKKKVIEEEKEEEEKPKPKRKKKVVEEEESNLDLEEDEALSRLEARWNAINGK